MSGGGAILHDAEITYCLAIPVAHPLAEDSSRLYTAVHEALVEVLYAQGVEAERVRRRSAIGRSEEPFLCFQRRAAGDVLVGKLKICGSAQRRRRGAIMQHGSLILSRSDAAPELPGLAQQAGFEMARGSTLVRNWAAAIARRLNLGLSPAALDGTLLDAVRTLALEKYSGQVVESAAIKSPGFARRSPRGPPSWQDCRNAGLKRSFPPAFEWFSRHRVRRGDHRHLCPPGPPFQPIRNRGPDCRPGGAGLATDERRPARLRARLRLRRNWRPNVGAAMRRAAEAAQSC